MGEQSPPDTQPPDRDDVAVPERDDVAVPDRDDVAVPDRDDVAVPERDDVAVPDHIAVDVDALPGGARAALEAVLMVVDEPVPEAALAAVLELPSADVRRLLEDLEEEYAAAPRGFALREVGGGWRFYSRGEHAAVVERFLVGGQRARLSQAALETLAVVAYRQPVSRARVSSVRGVNVDGVVRTLLSRGLIEESGTDPETGAVLYGTTGFFLERLGLRSLDDLPPLAPYLPEVDVLDELAQRGRS